MMKRLIPQMISACLRRLPMRRRPDLSSRHSDVAVAFRRPRRFAFGVALAPVALIATPAFAGDLEQAVTALRSIVTMRADFTQTDSNGGRVSGVISLKRPGMIRFQYQPGYPELIISDGNALTFVDIEAKQIQRWPIGNSPLGALLDPNRDVTRFGHVVPTGDAGRVAVEVRDAGHPEYGTLTLLMNRRAGAPGGLELEGWTTLDAQNRRTLIRLANPQYGVPLATDLFRYRNPLAGPHH